MKKTSKFWIVCSVILFPLLGFGQITPDSTHKKTSDSLMRVKDSSAMKMDTTVKDVPKTDTIKVVVDTVVKKDCYQQWYDAFKTRGAKAVPDGMQQVVIALKGPDGCHCFMGQIEVAGGKMKSPLYYQQENGDYRQVSTVGKKLEQAFAGSMTPDELYSIKDGMSIVFRTSDGEYGRLFFYKYVNKGAQSNKEAPSPEELIKD